MRYSLSIMVTGTIISIERCSLHDGPGLRTTVFLKGCPLSCLWCHNPESQSFKPELYTLNEKCVYCGLCSSVCDNHNVIVRGSNYTRHLINRGVCTSCGKCAEICPQSALEIKGTVVTARSVVDIVLKDGRYYKKSGGGLTISGGEPMAQFDFSLELLRLAKENNIHTCIETCGYTQTNQILSILQYVDLVMFDYKESNEDKHKEYTGVSNDQIIANLHAIDAAGAQIILRCPIIPGYNDTDEHFIAIAKTANRLNNITEINVMPYHPMGSSKSKRIGRKYKLADIGFPEDEQIHDWLIKIDKNTDVSVKKG